MVWVCSKGSIIWYSACYIYLMLACIPQCKRRQLAYRLSTGATTDAPFVDEGKVN